MAGSLSELIGQSSTVYIMGHRMADLDALGSAVGLLCLCRVKERPARIVINLQKNACQSLIAELKAAPGYEDLFISGQDALVEADNRRHTPTDVETELKHRLHAQRILWLHHGGLEQDDTDAHIDTLARFCPNNTQIISKLLKKSKTDYCYPP